MNEFLEETWNREGRCEHCPLTLMFFTTPSQRVIFAGNRDQFNRNEQGYHGESLETDNRPRIFVHYLPQRFDTSTRGETLGRL
jgi:hypothetical protein